MYRIPTMHNFTSAFSKVDNGEFLSRQLQQDYPPVTHDDLLFTSGKKSQVLERIGDRLNKSRKEVISIISGGEMDRV